MVDVTDVDKLQQAIKSNTKVIESLRLCYFLMVRLKWKFCWIKIVRVEIHYAWRWKAAKFYNTSATLKAQVSFVTPSSAVGRLIFLVWGRQWLSTAAPRTVMVVKSTCWSHVLNFSIDYSSHHVPLQNLAFWKWPGIVYKVAPKWRLHVQ